MNVIIIVIMMTSMIMMMMMVIVAMIEILNLIVLYLTRPFPPSLPSLRLASFKCEHDMM